MPRLARFAVAGWAEERGPVVPLPARAQVRYRGGTGFSRGSRASRSRRGRFRGHGAQRTADKRNYEKQRAYTT